MGDGRSDEGGEERGVRWRTLDELARPATNVGWTNASIRLIW
jgi:hypothetical protein